MSVAARTEKIRKIREEEAPFFANALLSDDCISIIVDGEEITRHVIYPWSFLKDKTIMLDVSTEVPVMEILMLLGNNLGRSSVHGFRELRDAWLEWSSREDVTAANILARYDVRHGPSFCSHVGGSASGRTVAHVRFDEFEEL